MVVARAENAGAVYMTDKLDYRAEVAKAAGAVWAGNPEREDVAAAIGERERLGVDVAYECAGEQETIDQAVEVLRPGGTLMLIGIPEDERVSFCIDKIRRKEIAIINVRRQNGCGRAAMDMVASGKANIDFMITHRFKAEQSKEAFDMVAGYLDGVVKAMIEF